MFSINALCRITTANSYRGCEAAVCFPGSVGVLLVCAINEPVAGSE